APGLVLEHRALAEPRPGGQACEARRLAAAGYDAHPRQAGDNAGPVFELIAAHEDEFVGAIGFLDDTRTREFDLAVVPSARTGRASMRSGVIVGRLGSGERGKVGNWMTNNG